MVLGSLAMAADDPTTAEQLLTAAWAESGLPDDPEAAGIAALMTADPLVRPAGRARRPCAGANARWRSSHRESSTYPIAQTYLVHGLGYAGHTDEAALAAAPAQDRPGETGQLG